MKITSKTLSKRIQNNEPDKLFYACLIELEHILDDLMTLNYELQESNYNMTTSDSEEKFNRYDRLKDVLFDLTVIRLYQLFEIHSLLGKHMTKNKTKLLPILKPQWKIILNEKNNITFWRNEIVAHSFKRANDFQLYNELDPNYDKSITEILKISRYAVIYLWSLRGNLHEEYELAWKIKDQKMSRLKYFDSATLLTKIISSEKRYFDQTHVLLKKNNFLTVPFCGYDDWPMSSNLSNKS